MFAPDDPVLEELRGALEPFGEETLERRLDRIEGLLKALGSEGIGRRVDRIARLLERSETDRSSEAIEFRGKLSELSCDVMRISEARADGATRQDVEDVLRLQRNEFGYVKEGLAWARGAATAGVSGLHPDSVRRSRSGLAMICLLWALTAAVAFGAGAVAFGGLRVDIAWEQGSAGPAAVGPTSLHGNPADERRRERARAEGFRHMPVLTPLRHEAVPPGEDVHPRVAPAGPPSDFAIPGEEVGPVYGPVSGLPAGQGAPVPQPRRGPAVAEPGTP